MFVGVEEFQLCGFLGQHLLSPIADIVGYLVCGFEWCPLNLKLCQQWVVKVIWSLVLGNKNGHSWCLCVISIFQLCMDWGWTTKMCVYGCTVSCTLVQCSHVALTVWSSRVMPPAQRFFGPRLLWTLGTNTPGSSLRALSCVDTSPCLAFPKCHQMRTAQTGV